NIVNNGEVNIVDNDDRNNVANVIIDYTETTKEGDPPAKRDVQPVPENYRRMMVNNMSTHPLWEAYCEAMQFQKQPVFTLKCKGLAFDMERQGFTADEVREVVRWKLKDKRKDYRFEYLADDLAQ